MRDRACALGSVKACELAVDDAPDAPSRAARRLRACEVGSAHSCEKVAESHRAAQDFACVEAFSRRACEFGGERACQVAEVCAAPVGPLVDTAGARLVRSFIAASQEDFGSYLAPETAFVTRRVLGATTTMDAEGTERLVRQMLAQPHQPEQPRPRWAEGWAALPGCSVRVATEQERTSALPLVFGLMPTPYVRGFLTENVARAASAEVLVVACRCLPGMIVVVDPATKKIVYRDSTPLPPVGWTPGRAQKMTSSSNRSPQGPCSPWAPRA
jgi:hypothetical protein